MAMFKSFVLLDIMEIFYSPSQIFGGVSVLSIAGAWLVLGTLFRGLLLRSNDSV